MRKRSIHRGRRSPVLSLRKKKAAQSGQRKKKRKGGAIPQGESRRPAEWEEEKMVHRLISLLDGKKNS